MTDDTPGPVRRRRKDARPAELLQAAFTVFAERGFADARMDEVAATAGVAKGTVYLYFPTKEALFKALVSDLVKPNLLGVLAAAGAEMPLRQVLEALLGRMVAIAGDPRLVQLPRLIVGEARKFPELARFYHDEVISAGLAALKGLMARAAARGEIRPVDPDSAARLLVAPMLFTLLWRSTFERFAPAPLDVETLLRTHMDVLMNGLAPRDGLAQPEGAA